MNVRVLLHVGLLMESLAAILAGIRSRIAVDEQMRGEGRGALERFAALFALQVRERERRIQIWNRLNICLQRVITHKYPEKEIEREVVFRQPAAERDNV